MQEHKSCLYQRPTFSSCASKHQPKCVLVENFVVRKWRLCVKCTLPRRFRSFELDHKWAKFIMLYPNSVHSTSQRELHLVTIFFVYFPATFTSRFFYFLQRFVFVKVFVYENESTFSLHQMHTVPYLRQNCEMIFTVQYSIFLVLKKE